MRVRGGRKQREREGGGGHLVDHRLKDPPKDHQLDLSPIQHPVMNDTLSPSFAFLSLNCCNTVPGGGITARGEWYVSEEAGKIGSSLRKGKARGGWLALLFSKLITCFSCPVSPRFLPPAIPPHPRVLMPAPGDGAQPPWRNWSKFSCQWALSRKVDLSSLIVVTERLLFSSPGRALSFACQI